MKAAVWALERGVSVVVCNGRTQHAIKNIMQGKKIGTFFTDSKNFGTPVETLAQNGECSPFSIDVKIHNSTNYGFLNTFSLLEYGHEDGRISSKSVGEIPLSCS